jgi:imidazolonepropionase-like amidohydrolase
MACGSAQSKGDKKNGELKLDVKSPWVDPSGDYPQRPGAATPGSALDNPDAPLIAIKGGTVMTATGTSHSPGMVVTRGGRILYVGADKAVPQGAEVIDARGRFVTPGIIDAHSHIGVYSAPHVSAHSDGNEMTAPATAQVRALYGYWPQDPAITRARAGGITSALILPGSANLVGGLGQAVIMAPARDARQVAFPGAPPAIKMACGENPKRVYAEKGGPATRMGEYAAFRALFQKAAEYDAKQAKYRRDRELWEKKRKRASELEAKAAKDGKSGRKAKLSGEAAPEPAPRDDMLESLAAVLRGEVMVQIHCYKASEIREMVAIADEFGFPIRAFHHALGAYKVRDILADKNIAIATWADWWGFKMEAFDGIPENAALFAEAGGRPIIHSDSSSDIQRLNQEAAKAYHAGLAAGVKLTEEQALQWITVNPAWAMGLHEIVGSLEKDKRADVVVWNRHPFSVYAKADLVMQSGVVTYRRKNGIEPTDFELGNWGLDSSGTREGKGVTR